MDTQFTLAIGSDIGEIPAVSERLGTAMEKNGFAPEEILDTQLAVEEVITNIIVHGYKQAGCPIGIAVRFTGEGIGIAVSDSAPQFDPLSIPEPDITADIDERRIGGLGIFLVRQVMDSLEYRYEDGKNILSMGKKRAA